MSCPHKRRSDLHFRNLRNFLQLRIPQLLWRVCLQHLTNDLRFFVHSLPDPVAWHGHVCSGKLWHCLRKRLRRRRSTVRDSKPTPCDTALMQLGDQYEADLSLAGHYRHQ